jgi:hypothetical protein
MSGIKAATVPRLDPLQSELLAFTAPFIEARIPLMPTLDGLTPAGEWTRIAPTLPRPAPKWCSMASNPLAPSAQCGHRAFKRPAKGVWA